MALNCYSKNIHIKAGRTLIGMSCFFVIYGRRKNTFYSVQCVHKVCTKIFKTYENI